jgi:hypothetical protein
MATHSKLPISWKKTDRRAKQTDNPRISRDSSVRPFEIRRSDPVKNNAKI